MLNSALPQEPLILFSSWTFSDNTNSIWTTLFFKRGNNNNKTHMMSEWKDKLEKKDNLSVVF